MVMRLQQESFVHENREYQHPDQETQPTLGLLFVSWDWTGVENHVKYRT
jgi:hypothetical protein